MTPSEQKTPTPRTRAFMHGKVVSKECRDFIVQLETSLAAQTAEVERLKQSQSAEGVQELYRKNTAVLTAEIDSLRASIAAKDEALLSLRAEISDVLWTSEDGNEQKPGNAESFREDGFPKLADAFEAAEKALSPSAGSELLAKIESLESVARVCREDAETSATRAEKADVRCSELLERVRTLEGALNKINELRNSIIAFQSVNFSEHVYPLVAALNAAGFKGMDYDTAKAKFGTMLERTNKAESLCDRLGRALEGWFAAQSRQRELMRAGDFRGSEEQGTTVHRRKKELDAALAEWRKDFPRT